jgi:hypothetical protein
MKDLGVHAIDDRRYVWTLSASFEFREIKVRLTIQSDLPLLTRRYIIARSQEVSVIVHLGGVTGSRVCAGFWSAMGVGSTDCELDDQMRAPTISEKPGCGWLVGR